MGRKNKNFNKFSSRAVQNEQPRDNDGRFAYNGGSGKTKVPTSYAGPARPATESKITLSKAESNSKELVKSSESSATPLVKIPATVVSPAVVDPVDSRTVPIISEEIQKAYKAYELVKENGIPLELKEFASDFEDSLEIVSFVPRDKADEEWSVSWCRDQEIAEGNSTAIAQAVHETLVYDIEEDEEDGNEFVDTWFTSIKGWRLNLLTIAFEGPTKRETFSGNLFISPTGQEWVVDYSAKAFDTRAPFPLIQPRALWQEWIKKQNDDKILLSTKVSR